jgi:plastocyanin
MKMNKLLGFALVCVVSVLLVCPASLFAQQTPASEGPDYSSGTNPKGEQSVLGCLVNDKGKYLVKEDATGKIYELQGRNDFQKYVDREVRVQGKTGQPPTARKFFLTMNVDRIALVAECHTAPQKTRTSAIGEPPVPEDAGQKPGQSNEDASAAKRAEIGLQGGTLGVNAQASGPNANQAEGRTQGPAGVTVNMAEASYVPRVITVHVGEAVEWKNISSKPHTVTIDPDKATNRSDVALPANAPRVDSGYIPVGGTYRYVFNVPGTYKYFCTLDEGNGMVGEVVVKPR